MSLPVFAGLGSTALFSSSTQATALADCSTPEARTLLNACHRIFLAELSTSTQDDCLQSGISLDDFEEPQSLLFPLPRYHRNAIIQNTTLSLVQLLRYLAHCVTPSNGNSKPKFGAAGVCSGLLTAVAVAAHDGAFQFLSYSQQSFHLALLLGIRIEQHTKQVLKSSQCVNDLPWSMILDGLKLDQAEELTLTFEQKNPGTHVYVSARSTERCVTLSGRGDQLLDFCRNGLPKNCRVRPTNIYSAYHDAKTLVPVKAKILADCAKRGIVFPSFADLKVPIYYGKPVPTTNQATLENSTLEFILDLILVRPVDWLSAQQQIFADIAIGDDGALATKDVLNFGPGYGVSKSEAKGKRNVQVLDASIGPEALDPAQDKTNTSDDDIAIVGMAVDLPGAPDTEGLWKVLRDEINMVSEVPESRFHVDDFYENAGHKALDPRRSLGTKFGNFIDDPFRFDNSFFGISPREAKSIDPQQRVILQTTYKALEDAGYVPDATPSFARDTFGCYIGNATLDYPDNLKNDIDVYYAPGTLRAFLSGRLSYMFGFSGPSMTVDTACSSSMVAIYQACRALTSGDCRAAVAGGVNVISSPDMYLGLDRAHFLSPTGQCKAFDASADGYCRSEGCGVFILKKLSDALEESDNILGIIKGIEVNQSGNAHSITHPHAPTQERLFDKLFTKADIDPLRISVVEAHGTGTQAGDPQESTSIRNALCEGRDEHNPLYLTSVKANIGHCEAASGAAALAKLLLMTQKQVVPAQVSLQNLNPRIAPLGVDGTIIAQEQEEWPSSDGQPRLSMLNNFGAAGSNTALILQEHQEVVPPRKSNLKGRQNYTFGFSAKTKSALLAFKKILIPYLERGSATLSLRDICYSSMARRQIYKQRSAVCASSVLELAEKLRAVEPVDIKKNASAQPSVVFLFSGQGSQYMGMGQELFASHPTFRRTVLECDSWLQESGFPGCLQIISPGEQHGGDIKNEDGLQAMQTSIFVLEAALARLWREWGVQPAVVAGHSIGQYAALVSAGVLDIIDALKIVAFRARLMIEKCPLGTTGMLAVNGGTTKIEDFIESKDYSELSIACCNSPHDCVVGGPLQSLKALKEDLKVSLGSKSTLLNNPMAYHTSAMAGILPDLTKLAATVKWSSPKIPVICNVLGRVVAKGEEAFGSEFPAQHCHQTVLFEQGVTNFLSKGQGDSSKQVIWIEIGPHPSILPMVKTKIQIVPGHSMASMRKSVNPWVTLSEAFSQLYVSNLQINWRNTFSGSPKSKCTTLPSYQFDYTNFLIDYHESRENSITAQKPPTGYAFLTRVVQEPSESNDQVLVLETPIDVLAEYIKGHIVCDYALCPASVYHEMALAAVVLFDKGRIQEPITQINGLSEVAYLNPLLHSDGSQRIVKTSISLSNTDYPELKNFLVASYECSDPKTVTQHCRGSIKSQSKAATQRKFNRLHAQVEKSIARIKNSDSSEVFRTKAIYEKLFPRVVTYSDMYQAVQAMSITDDGTEALASVKIPISEVTTGSDFANSPILMDVLLHVAGFVANLAVENEDACICKEVKSAKVFRAPTDTQEGFQVYCSNTELADENAVIADAYAIASDGGIFAVFKGMHFTRVKLAKVEAHFRHVFSKGNYQGSKSKQDTVQRGSGGVSKPKTGTSTSHAHTPKLQKEMQGSSVPAIDLIQMEMQSKTLPAIDLKAIVAEVCGTKASSVKSDMELEALGIDSLMIFELESRIRERADGAFTTDELTACSTVSDLEELLSSKGAMSTTNDRKLQTSMETPLEGREALAAGPSVTSVIAETCGPEESTLAADTELESLGIDSLMMIELEERLLDVFGADFDSTGLASCKTVGDVDHLVGSDGKPVEQESSPSISSTVSSSTLSSAPSSPPAPETPATPPEHETSLNAVHKDLSKRFRIDDSLKLIQSGKGRAYSEPLILIHDGSGINMKYKNIKPLNRELWGISNPKMFTQDTWDDLSSMASAYAAKISATINGPCIIGGWSFGGVVAFHAAHLLLAQHYPIKGVVLIDSPAPLDHQPLPIDIIDAIIKTPDEKPNEIGKAIKNAIRRQFTLNTAMLADFKPAQEGPLPKMVLLRSTEGFDASALACAHHSWLEDRSDQRTAAEGWERVVDAEVEVIDIPGNHFDVFENVNVKDVSNAIIKACEML